MLQQSNKPEAHFWMVLYEFGLHFASHSNECMINLFVSVSETFGLCDNNRQTHHICCACLEMGNHDLAAWLPSTSAMKRTLLTSLLGTPGKFSELNGMLNYMI